LFSETLSQDTSETTAPIGILVTNTGTPEAPTAKALRPYLAQFLSDRRVIDYPRWLWLPILHGIILNIRPRRSARLYQNIWTPEGSPLLVTIRKQAKEIETRLVKHFTNQVKVAVGLCYGRPSIPEGLEELRAAGIRRLLVFPLYPQYSAATAGAALDAVFDTLKSWRWVPELRTINHYYGHPAYLQALVNSIWENCGKFGKPKRLLFSFHGIPLRYAESGDPYRYECVRTAHLAADMLGLDDDSWGIAFQSRFGPETWIGPYTDQVLAEWGKSGLEKICVICPGFSADCLETLDEIGREGKKIFLDAGGWEFGYIPALNDRPDHIHALTEIVLANLEGWVQSRNGKTRPGDENRARDEFEKMRHNGKKGILNSESIP